MLLDGAMLLTGWRDIVIILRTLRVVAHERAY
jgi:hypothetical protein